MRMTIRRALTILAVILPAISSLMEASPGLAVSTGGGGGVVVGTASLTPGYALPPSLAAPQAYLFSSITFDGAFLLASVNGASGAEQGCVTTSLVAQNVEAASNASGWIAEDTGTVFPFTAAGTCDAVGGVGAAYATAFDSLFVRVGGLMTIVSLNGTCTMGAVQSPCGLVVAGTFEPTNPSQNPIVNFTLRGAFAAEGS